ncbi:MAG: hypothetical protein ABSG31_06990 [Tepidisphaeraceae bacterium]
MKSLNINFGFLVGLCFRCSHLLADDYPPRPLPDSDRQTLNEYLGAGVVGEAISAPALPHGLNDLISIHDGIAWQMRVISGKAPGTVQNGSALLLDRPGGMTGFRLDLGDGRNVLFGQLDPQGNFMCYASEDNREGVISRFTPAQPIFLADMVPGQTREIVSNVSVADLSQPDVQTHSGQLNIQFTYLGAYRLRVPAGTFDALLMKSHLTGKVGPATIDDTVYRFLAKNAGPVAVVETNDVSAVLIYHEATRIGKVLVETTNK